MDPPYGREALSNATSRPSIRPSVCFILIPLQRAFWGYGYYRTLIGNPYLQVEPIGHCGCTVTGNGRNGNVLSNPSPLQKHSLGGCTVDIPPSYCHRRGNWFRHAMYAW